MYYITLNEILFCYVIIKMLGDYQSNPHNTLTYQLFADWLNPSTGRRSRSHSSALLEEYQSRRIEGKSKNVGQGLIDKLMTIADVKVQEEFHKTFVFGASMEIWRKGRVKTAEIFIDPYLPSLLWISSKTKAFLFDLTYTTVDRVDLQLQKSSKIKHYIVLHYFQQSLPLVFREQKSAQADKYFELFSNFILHNKCHHVYPPYFSRIMKLYTVEEIKDNLSRKRRASDVLKVSQLIGLNQDQLNWKVLQAIVSKNQPQNLTDTTEINHHQIGQYFKILHCCEGMKDTFEKYSEVKIISYLQYLVPMLTRENFKQFLIFQQNEDEETITQILQQTKEMISFYDFCEFLLSEKSNYACAPEPVNEDLPLTDYFCYSSHNTYLSGNQLTSDSKIQRYIEDLQGGVKCVETDVHNDGHRPIITHALNDKSLCKPIDFQETITSISRFCEQHPNHYPIIISVQNHATDANRYKMLNNIFHAFGKKLFILNNQDPNESVVACKKLSELKGKVIIKTDSNINQLMPFRKKMQQASPIKCQQKYYSIPIAQHKPTLKDESYKSKYDRFHSIITQFQNRKNQFIANCPKQLYLPLAEMTKITGMFKSPSGANNNQSCGYECTSYTNQKAIKTKQDLILNYTKRSWLRIYPLGTEIASNNFNPVPCLKIGAQIIALNTQTKDNYAWLMMSYFTAGRQMIPGKLGYIPKPLHLRSQVPKPAIQKMIQIKIISTNQKISIKFYGTDRDQKSNQGSSLSFQVKDYDQGFLMFSINEKFKDCLPMRFIRKGYRVLIAKNEMYRDSGIRVLIFISITESAV